MDAVIEIRGLTYTYSGEQEPVLRNVQLQVPRGARCLVVGRNGAGKSTLLQVLAGKHMVPVESARVLGRPAFHDTSLAAHVSFVGGPFPFKSDIAVAEIVSRTEGVDPVRRDTLYRVLGIDPAWRMYRVSDGQRRCVQLLLGLLQPVEVLLLDEVTTELDLIARMDLLEFLRQESTLRGVTILHATHILDRLEDWCTHVMLVEDGRVVRMQAIQEVPEYREAEARGVHGPLIQVVDAWLRGGGAPAR
ncbi:MAG: ATP-binding cassette domain-containing protein [Myxococcota bacterium]